MILAQVMTNLPPDTAADIAKVLSDFHVHVSVSQLTQAIAAIVIVARLLRKGVPDNMQTGKLGTILAHCALEINPQTKNTKVSLVAPVATATQQKN